MSLDKVYLKTLNQNVTIIDQFNADGIDYVTVKLDNGAVLIAQLNEVTDIGNSVIENAPIGKPATLTISLESGQIVDRQGTTTYKVGDEFIDNETKQKARVLRVNE